MKTFGFLLLVVAAGPDAMPIVSSSAAQVVTMPAAVSWRRVPSLKSSANPEVRRNDTMPEGTFLVAKVYPGAPPFKEAGPSSDLALVEPIVRLAAKGPPAPATFDEWQRAAVVSTAGKPLSIVREGDASYVLVERKRLRTAGKLAYDGAASQSPDGRFVAVMSSDILERGSGLFGAPPPTLIDQFFELLDAASGKRLVLSTQKKSRWAGDSHFSWIGSRHLAVLLERNPLVLDREADVDAPARLLWIDLEQAEAAAR